MWMHEFDVVAEVKNFEVRPEGVYHQ